MPAATASICSLPRRRLPRKKKSAQKVAAPAISLARQKAGLPQADEEDEIEETSAAPAENTEPETPAKEPESDTSPAEPTSETAESDGSEETAPKDEPTQTEEDAK